MRSSLRTGISQPMAHFATVILFAILFLGDNACTTASKSDSDEPLMLTKYVDSGDITTARRLSRTGPLPDVPPVLSYNGFMTVNKKLDSNLFFWFFPALNHNKSAPLLLWLQGGPGLPSMYGLFNEHGPYEIYQNMTAGLRKHSWAQSMHMLYVDNPVGTGFSFTKDDKGYPTNEDEVAKDLYEFLRQFYVIFHEYKNNDFYVTGESYACKYVPAVAYKIHKIGPASGINLKGVSVGNGLCEFETMAYYGDYYYNLGLVDENQAAEMNKVSRAIVKLIREKKFRKAFFLTNSLTVANDSMAANFTGFHYYYNMLVSESPPYFDYYVSYLQLPKFRRAVHVGNLTFMADGKETFAHLLEDTMKSEKSEITVLMNNYKFMFYSGQLDLRIPHTMTLNFLKTVKWKYQKEYKTAKRQIWRLAGSGAIAGYVHQVEDFYEVLVRNAGHIVPHDQPESALDLITRFVNDIPFS